jgi:hypothetical protein
METHMRTRTLFLAVLAGGPALGALAGLTVDTRMIPPPEPYWRHLASTVRTPDASSYFVEDAPQDTSPWINDRTPTWKRRLARSEPVHVPARAEAAPDPVLSEAAAGDAMQEGVALRYGVGDPVAPAPAADQPQAEAGGDSPAVIL